MNRSGVRKQFWLSESQAKDLSSKAKAAGLSEVGLIRMLLAGYRPAEAPGEEFHRDMNKLLLAADYLKDASGRALDVQTKNLLFDESMQLREFRYRLMQKYLTAEKENIKWQ